MRATVAQATRQRRRERRFVLQILLVLAVEGVLVYLILHYWVLP